MDQVEREALMADFGELLAKCRHRVGVGPPVITRRMRESEKAMLRLRRQGYSVRRIAELLNFESSEVRHMLRAHGLAD